MSSVWMERWSHAHLKHPRLCRTSGAATEMCVEVYLASSRMIGSEGADELGPLAAEQLVGEPDTEHAKT